MAQRQKSTNGLLWEQYDAICNDRAFKSAHRLKAILKYLLEAAENGKDKKGRDVAMDVFEIAEPNDAELTTVRAAVGKLRQKLLLYYCYLHSHGMNALIIIEIEEGSVRARYRVPDPNEPPRTSGGPTSPAGQGTTTGTGNSRTALEEFFGEGAWSTAPNGRRGVIVLRSDSSEALDRVVKARRWINACDADGAYAIIAKFNEYKINVAELLLSYEPNSSELNYKHTRSVTSQALFEITMGGRTEKTKAELNQIGAGWMRITETAEPGNGDSAIQPWRCALLFDRRVAAHFSQAFTLEDAEGNFQRLLPRDWGPGYIDRWVQQLSHPRNTPVRDYAVILRHTSGDERRKVRFYLSGFTEVGTAAAGHFLAAKWQKLWETYVMGRTQHWSRGDFLVVIQGPSDPHLLREQIDPPLDHPELEGRCWEVAGAITPESPMLKGISCVWKAREQASPKP